MVAVSGLPGSGKSYFSQRLAERVPLLVVESDLMRRSLFARPDYSPDESTRLFSACHALLRDLLFQRVPVLVDATSLTEAHREALYSIADATRAGLVLVSLTAPAEVVRRRLAARVTETDREDHSEAGWDVYLKMLPTGEPIGRDHFLVDTSGDISPDIDVVGVEITRLMRCARSGQADKVKDKEALWISR